MQDGLRKMECLLCGRHWDAMCYAESLTLECPTCHNMVPVVLGELPDTCNWTEDADGIWSSGCDHDFLFNEDTPVTNGFKFCPYCGKPLTETPFVEEEDDAD